MEPWEKDLDPVQRDFLEQPRRREIVELLAGRPGLNESQIARDLGIHLNLARFHLERLEAVDLVEVQRSPRGREKVCFLPRDLDLWEDPRTRVLFGGSRVTEVARVVVRKPGSTASEIGEELGLSRSGTHRHLNTLRKAGLIRRFRIKQAYRHYPAPVLETWVEHTGNDGDE